MNNRIYNKWPWPTPDRIPNLPSQVLQKATSSLRQAGFSLGGSARTSRVWRIPTLWPRSDCRYFATRPRRRAARTAVPAGNVGHCGKSGSL